jgi:hypothetical protein
MFDVILWFFDQFMVKIFNGFNLLVYIHGKEFLFVNNTISVLDALTLLVLGLFMVLFFILYVFFAKLIIFSEGFRLMVCFGFG